MNLQRQPGKMTANDRTNVVGHDTDQPSPAATALPVVREQAPQGGRLMVSLSEATLATQEATAKRVRDAEPGEPGPPTKRTRTTGTSSAEYTATFPLQAETGLLAMPDEVLQLIVAALDTPETVADVRHLQWLRACGKALQERIAAPLPGVVQDLKYQASEKNIRAVLSDTRLDGQQVQTQVRALCDRYGDVRVSLRNKAGLLPTSPNVHHRNRYALAGIGESREMRSLQLGLDGAQDVTVKSLCNALRQTAPTRVSLTVRRMKWGNEAVAALLDVVSQSNAIASVEVDGSGGVSGAGFRFMEQGGWGAKPVQSLGRMLQENRSLELLDLSWMHPGDDAIEAIAQSLAVNSTLVQLKLPGNALSGKGMHLLGEALGSNVGLATLKLDENRLGPRGAQGLLAGLRKNRTLTALSLSRCNASDATALELFSLFEHNDTLRSFEFRHAAIKGPVVACLARLLQAGRRLEVLDLPGSPIGVQGAQAIADLLASDTMLSSLDLSCCSIGDDELRLLEQGVLRNTGLRHLNIAGNHDVTSTGISRMASALESHRQITSLNFGGIRIDSTGVKALAGSLLANHPTLELLDLSHCMTGPKSRRIIAEAMQANTRLKKLVTTIPESALESSDSE